MFKSPPPILPDYQKVKYYLMVVFEEDMTAQWTAAMVRNEEQECGGELLLPSGVFASVCVTATSECAHSLPA